MRAALIYQHATKERDRVIADSMDVLLEGRELGGRQAWATGGHGSRVTGPGTKKPTPMLLRRGGLWAVERVTGIEPA